jgi:YtxH-like protein
LIPALFVSQHSYLIHLHCCRLISTPPGPVRHEILVIIKKSALVAVIGTTVVKKNQKSEAGRTLYKGYNLLFPQWGFLWTLALIYWLISQTINCGTGFEVIQYKISITYLKFIIMTTTTKVILGLVGAAAVGAAVGMLLAPEKGSDIRKNIKDSAGKWSDKLSDMWQNGKKAAEKASSRMQTEM